jgi:hypothetical protein
MTGGENAQRDGEIEAATILGQFGWRQIHRDPAIGVFKSGVLNRHTHTITRLAHRRFRQSNDIGTWEAAGKMHFHHHLWSSHPFLGTT